MTEVGLNLSTPCGDTILLNQYGNIQILCELSVPNCKQILQTRRLSLSPEELQAKNNPTLNFGLDRPKSQAFNIGITMIELGTLKRCDRVYDRNEIKQSEIVKQLEELSKLYSDFFTKIVGSMVRIDPVQRSSTGQIWAALSPYQQKINNVKSFDARKDATAQSLRSYLKTHYKIN